ncbi:carcinoembryonic antigen-related cell adhesion molecule 5-like [Danio aesculapii]|uniref:carcinoembryonic antigen-related cell adhesion molecule 5-like n=1 Tax=Danio aesculapii TaxID=1142201 RepID=UPI0024C088B0|nr:carcinoembryonic antigen-related cell adhesion molecule 5-like [Danio aesculapii]
MLMWLRMAPALHLIFLLIIHRVSSAGWGVNYSPTQLCALQNSTMTISCTFTYLTPGYQVMKVFWNIDQVYYDGDFVDLSNNSEYSQRLQYLGDKQQNCTVRLSHVTKTDEHEYFFRFTTNITEGRWIGHPGVRLSVTDLQLESPERVTEGDSVRLTCNSSCTLTDTPTFIWYRNSHTLTNIRDELNISSIKRTEAGHYSCGVQGQTYISPAVYLDVRYAPDTPVISINRSAVIMEGDSVTLICSSDSNPPAEINWFKGETFVGSGRIFNISKISSDDSKKYKCRARNDLGEKYSDPVTLDVQYPPRNVSVSMNRSAVIMSGDSVTLSCSSDSNPPTLNFSWFKGNKSLNTGRIFSISKISSDDSGEYKCRARNDHGEKYSDPVTLDVQYAPDTPVISNRSAVIMEGDSVTLNCSSDSNPPAEINWYKGNTSLNTKGIFNISKISSDDSGEYKCRARNKHGVKYSDPVTLDVQYPPRNISVSMNRSAAIMSGDSVSLSCISDSNPPAEISWFKGETSVRSGRIFNISKISSDDSGEYKCRYKNVHGEKYSDPVTLDVQYPPRNVSVSVTDSGQLWSDSVSLMCSSDSNPPAQNFSWFKENQSSAVGSGQSFSAVQSGRFYCEAHNPHGAQRSDAVTVTVHQGAGRNIIIITATSVAILIIIIIFVIISLFIIKKQRSVKSEGLTVMQNDLYSDVSQKDQAHDNPVCDPGLADEAPYETVNPRISAECRDAEEIQYATVQYHKNTQMKREEEEEQRQCDNIPLQQPDQDHRQETVETVEESVIYSMLK